MKKDSEIPTKKTPETPSGFKWDLSDNDSIFNKQPTLRQLTQGKFPHFTNESDSRKFEKN